jgi:hypothetical protein
MKQLLLICAVVALAGCGKKEAPRGEIRVRVQRSTPKPEPPKAAPANIADTIVEKAIRHNFNKRTGELTKADYEKVTKLDLQQSGRGIGVVIDSALRQRLL